jgi:peptidoglycan biosynthesis protein MviN/MurJ (putative lipid II flippase)
LVPSIIGNFFKLNKDIFLSSFIVTFGLLLGRLFGFLREVLIASKFGISSESDIATILLTIPDFLVGLIAGGALSAVLIPEFQKIENMRLKINFLIKSSILLILALTLICFFFRYIFFKFSFCFSTRA